MSEQVLIDPTIFYWSDSLYDLVKWLDKSEYVIPKSIGEISRISRSDKYYFLHKSYYLDEIFSLLKELESLLKNEEIKNKNELLSDINFVLKDLKNITDYPPEYRKKLTVFFSYLIWPNRNILYSNSTSEQLIYSLNQVERCVTEIINPKTHGLIEWLNFQAGYGDIPHVTPEIMLFLTQLGATSAFLEQMCERITYKEMCKSRVAFQKEIEKEVTIKGLEYITKGSTKFLNQIPENESVIVRTRDNHNVIKRMGPIKRFQYYLGEKISNFKEKEKKKKIFEGLNLIISAYSTIKEPSSILSKGLSLTIEYFEEQRDWSRISGALKNIAESSEKEKTWWKRNICKYINEKNSLKEPQLKPELLKDLIMSLRSWYNDPLVIESSMNEEEASILGRLPSHFNNDTITKIKDLNLIPSLKNFFVKVNIYGKGDPILPYLKPWYGSGFIKRSQ
ncbi:MAG: hypothetical protein ACFFC7_18705 [Candidatus Hermodarchaeota archaeon]